jgi:hypothetical protein
MFMSTWDRLPKESETAYEAFKVFLNLDDKRSIRAAAKKLTKSHGTLHRWYLKFHWKDRARDFDNNKERAILAAAIALEKKRLREVISKKHEFGYNLESLAGKSIARLNVKLDNDPDFLVSPKDLTTLLALGFELQEAKYPESENERNGIQALAESIKALADRTITQYESQGGTTHCG